MVVVGAHLCRVRVALCAGSVCSGYQALASQVDVLGLPLGIVGTTVMQPAPVARLSYVSRAYRVFTAACAVLWCVCKNSPTFCHILYYMGVSP